MVTPWTSTELGVTQWWMLLSCTQEQTQGAEHKVSGGRSRTSYNRKTCCANPSEEHVLTR
jgi:hypothetical protein